MSDEDVQRISSSFDALARTLLTDDANPRDALGRVAGTGCAVLANCSSASITIIEGGRTITMGSTSDTAQALDDAQYTSGDGPCLTAARDRVLVRVDDTATEERWTDFTARAVQHGVRSSLSVPLILSGDTWGGFNVYGTVASGFSGDDEQLCQAFAAQASIVVSNVKAYWASLQLSANLSRAMETRAVIEQAKGILMSTHRIGADDAFDRLVARSQTENRKLRDIAGDIVRQARPDDDE